MHFRKLYQIREINDIFVLFAKKITIHGIEYYNFQNQIHLYYENVIIVNWGYDY